MKHINKINQNEKMQISTPAIQTGQGNVPESNKCSKAFQCCSDIPCFLTLKGITGRVHMGSKRGEA